jgi:hypothetical protein
MKIGVLHGPVGWFFSQKNPRIFFLQHSFSFFQKQGMLHGPVGWGLARLAHNSAPALGSVVLDPCVGRGGLLIEAALALEVCFFFFVLVYSLLPLIEADLALEVRTYLHFPFLGFFFPLVLF